MKKDIILKDITKEAVKDILKYLIKIEIDDFEFLDIEFEKIEVKKADILVKAKNKIIHIELQSSNDYSMVYRMARYYIEIASRYKKSEIYQYVIYIGKKKNYMKNELIKDNMKFKFDIIDMKKIPCEKFLKLETPEALVLSILCDFEDRDVAKTIKEILEKLIKVVKNENEFRKYILMLEELSTSRDLKTKIKEAEMGLQHLRWEDLPSWEIGMEYGMKAGIEKGMEKGIKKGLENGKIVALYEVGFGIEDIAKRYNKSIDEVKKVIATFEVK